MKKAWPVRQQLVSWFLYEKLDAVPPGTLTPNMVHDWLTELDSMSSPELHQRIYDGFADFQREFAAPSDPIPSKG